MTGLATRTIQKIDQRTNSLTILQRIAERDKTAVKDCVDTYGKFIWALAKKFTASTEEAEAATQEIFTDIWRYSERPDDVQSVEKKLIAMIALRRLFRHLPTSQTKSMASIDAPNEQGQGRTEFQNHFRDSVRHKTVRIKI